MSQGTIRHRIENIIYWTQNLDLEELIEPFLKFNDLLNTKLKVQ